MAEPVPNWFAPVYSGLVEPLTMAGVPQTFAAMDAIAALLCALALWLPGVFTCGVAYGVVRLGTYYDAQIFAVIRAHVQYKRHYEG